jgi:hypothetical protein
MANTLRIKRRASGGAAGAPASLANAELAYNEQDNTLYYGFGTGGAGGSATSVIPIGGPGAFVGVARSLSTAANSGLAGGGDLSANRALSVDLSNLATATVAASTDYVALHDGTSTKRITKANFLSGLGVGTVTSVALSLPSLFTVSGSPVTASGTLSASLASQSANTVFAAPNGSAGAPTFRALVAGDIPTLTAAKLSDFDTQVRTSRLDQMTAPTAAVSFNSQKLTNLATPTADGDAATKAYVDAARSGLDVKQSVRLASSASVSATYAATGGTSARGQFTAAPNTLDGVNLAAGDRLLLKDQNNAAQNGVWSVSTLGTGSNGVWDRATDFDADALVTSGAFMFVEEGTSNADSGWVLTTNNPIVIGGASGTALAFAQFSGAGQITAGAGLTKTGSTLDVVGTANRITVNADSVDIASTYAGQTSITTLGTVGTGTWQGAVISPSFGGSGVNNGSFTTTLGGNVNLAGALTTSGAFGITLVATAATSVTLPTSGTLLSDTSAIDGGTF